MLEKLHHLLFRIKIEGESAWPFLIPGRTYLASNILKPRVGDFVVFKNPRNPVEVFVKKVTAVEGDQYRVKSTVSWGGNSFVVSRDYFVGKLINQGATLSAIFQYARSDRTSVKRSASHDCAASG